MLFLSMARSLTIYW